MFVFQSLLLFLVTTLVAFVIQFRWNRKKLYELAAKLPGTDGLPVIGLLHKLVFINPKDYLDIMLTYVQDNFPISKVWLGPKLIVLTKSPEVMHAVFNSPQCNKKPSVFYGSLVFTEALFSLSENNHKKHRKIFNKAFTPKRMLQLYDIIDNKSQVCVKKLEEKVGCKEFDVYFYIGACSLESFALANYNHSRDLYGSELLHAVDRGLGIIMKRIQQPWLNNNFLFKLTKMSKHFDKITEMVDNYLNDVISHNKNLAIDTNGTQREDRVIDLLLDSKSDFTDKEIRDEFVIFGLTAFDSTSKSLSAALLMLAMHKNVQQKLIDEIDTICGNDQNIKFDHDFLQKFTYLDQVVKETIRLFPAGPTVARETSEDVEICGYVIPKDTIMVMSIFGMQRDPKYWGNDAHLYRPERFENLDNPQAFLPFTAGKRMCIGYRYAMIVMKTFLINFFRAYTVDTTLKYKDLKLEMSLALIITNRYKISLKKR